jgi:lincosamide nucleotidyltransferase A/C/D/E
MMQAADILQIIDWFEQADIPVWLDGGWGIDALVGHQTRSHSDLDVVVWLNTVTKIEQLLTEQGFIVKLSELPTRFVMEDERDRSIDFHTVKFDTTGNLVQVLQDGTVFRYPSDSLSGQGIIDGHVVFCITPEAQLLSHTGYEPMEKDIYNVRLLLQYFDLEVPIEYVGRV